MKLTGGRVWPLLVAGALLASAFVVLWVSSAALLSDSVGVAPAVLALLLLGSLADNAALVLTLLMTLLLVLSPSSESLSRLMAMSPITARDAFVGLLLPGGAATLVMAAAIASGLAQLRRLTSEDLPSGPVVSPFNWSLAGADLAGAPSRFGWLALIVSVVALVGLLGFAVSSRGPVSGEVSARGPLRRRGVARDGGSCRQRAPSPAPPPLSVCSSTDESRRFCTRIVQRVQ